ncbi:MAG: hypothetical protein CL678_00605 [Bdellovibrionaceae bacterium]|nr:hypothetical protein [Pseudobdellovibrionaceae bacterium]
MITAHALVKAEHAAARILAAAGTKFHLKVAPNATRTCVKSPLVHCVVHPTKHLHADETTWSCSVTISGCPKTVGAALAAAHKELARNESPDC